MKISASCENSGAGAAAGAVAAPGTADPPTANPATITISMPQTSATVITFCSKRLSRVPNTLSAVMAATAAAA
ncbi:hypothetical protein D3C83_129150 [compost metagenome]